MWGTMFSHDELSAQQHHPRDMQMPSRGRRVVRLPMWQSNKKIRREWGEVVVVVGGWGWGGGVTRNPLTLWYAFRNVQLQLPGDPPHPHPPPHHRVQICNATTATTKIKSPTATLMTHPYQCNQAIKQTKKQTNDIINIKTNYHGNSYKNDIHDKCALFMSTPTSPEIYMQCAQLHTCWKTKQNKKQTNTKQTTTTTTATLDNNGI